MAVKKANTKKEESVETKVDAVVETPAEEIEIPDVEVESTVEEAEVEVDTEKAEVKKSNKPTESVKIRMRVDHKCCIAMERYDLKAGKTYVVPENVRRILNNAGLLAPL